MNRVSLYVVPIIAFLITMILMYLMDSSEETVKNDPKHILIRIILPSLVMAVLTYVVLRYKDSDILNLSVMYSRDGLRYSSAVDERIYISKNKKVSPTGHIANCIPNSPNHFQK